MGREGGTEWVGYRDARVRTLIPIPSVPPLPPPLLRPRLSILGRGRDTAVRHVIGNHVISGSAPITWSGSGVNSRPAVNTSKDEQPGT